MTDARTQAWRKSGDYLPDFMRDFQDQKDLFKAMQEVVERSNEANSGHRALQASWTEYHIYTVDIFLWVMAGHGYTLQRSRKPVPFADIFAFVKKAKDRWQGLSALLSALPASGSEGKG